MTSSFSRRTLMQGAGAAFLLSALGIRSLPAMAAVPGPSADTLVFLNYRDLRDLNPHLYGGEMFAQEMLFEGLITLGNDGSYHPAVAQSWTISPDGRVYTFRIRKGMTFTDGEKLDAHAVQANFDALIDNKKRHTWLEMMRLLVSAKAVDDETFVIEMKEPYYPMLTELAVTRPFAFVSPKVMKNGTTKDGVTAFVGSGPWKLVEHVIDEYSVFERNEDYWGAKPAFRRVVVKVIPDNQTRILALEKGEADLIWGKNMVDADALNKYRSSDRFGIAVSDPTSTRQIVLNTNNEFLADVRVRRAARPARQGSDRRAHHGDPHLDRRGEAPRTLRVRAQAPARRRGLHPDHVRDEQGALPQDGRQRRLPLEPVRSAVRRHDARWLRLTPARRQRAP